MWKAKIIMETLKKSNPSQNELDFVESVINGGKTDNFNRSRDICAYLDEFGKEQIVYEKLLSLTHNA